ncbi:beta-lactamase family protein [bacterium]|nr:beta-lactamase family protein [bacterium]
MKINMKILLGIAIIIVVLLFGYADYYLWRLLSAGAGVEAKMLCSGVFVSGRSPESIMNEDLHHSVNYIRLEVDTANHAVTATAFGVIQRRALFREGLGSTLLAGCTEDELRSQADTGRKSTPQNQKNLPWPSGDLIVSEDLPAGIDTQKLKSIMDEAFSEPDPKLHRRTRAVVVVYDGHIIAERYAPDFTKDMPLLGYGMTQSVMNALAGILVCQGKLSVHEPAPVPEWSSPGDPCGAITTDQLLRMSSGLTFDDSHPPLTDSVIMFGSPDMAAYAAGKPLAAKPDTRWAHSNGTSNIIARIIRTAVGGTLPDYFAFPHSALFDRIGMRSAVLEPDVSGTFVGSTYMYATARDWARFGLLYLQDGVWEGERILPDGWVAYSKTPTPTDPAGEYGAHFWTNAGSAAHPGKGQWPHLPPDAFFALGHDGQSLTIIPSRKLVVVRLGLTKEPEAWNLDSFIAGILDAVGE